MNSVLNCDSAVSCRELVRVIQNRLKETELAINQYELVGNPMLDLTV